MGEYGEIVLTEDLDLALGTDDALLTAIHFGVLRRRTPNRGER